MRYSERAFRAWLNHELNLREESGQSRSAARPVQQASRHHQQQTSLPNVYAIGDITGRTMLAHGASYEAEVAAEVIAGHKRTYQARTVPAVVFTDPEIATAGLPLGSTDWWPQWGPAD